MHDLEYQRQRFFEAKKRHTIREYIGFGYARHSIVWHGEYPYCQFCDAPFPCHDYMVIDALFMKIVEEGE